MSFTQLNVTTTPETAVKGRRRTHQSAPLNICTNIKLNIAHRKKKPREVLAALTLSVSQSIKCQYQARNSSAGTQTTQQKHAKYLHDASHQKSTPHLGRIVREVLEATHVSHSVKHQQHVRIQRCR